MGIPYFGGFEYAAAGRLGPNAVYVDVDTSYDDRLYQLYAGRTLVGCTRDVAQTRVIGQVNDGDNPAPLTVLAVEPGDAATDFGALIPAWPSDRYELDWSTSGSPADMDHFLVTGSTAPGGSVDPNHVVARVPFVGDGAYSIDLPPLGGCGVWQFTVTPYDNALPDGNAGTGATVSVTATVPPPDLVPDPQGNRFEASASAGTLSLSLTYP